MFATVTDKGQVTVPKEIRDQLGIVPGSRLAFQVESDGSLRVRPQKRGSANLAGLLHDPSRVASTIEGMDDAVTRHLVADDARIEAATGKGRKRR